MQKPDRNLVAPSREIVKLERRLFLKQGLSLGALGLLSGCDVTDADAVQKVLWQMSRWNDGVQAAIFNPNKLAQEYPESAITKPFPFNAFYSEAEAPRVDPATYKLELSGLIRDKAPWTLDKLYALPQTSQVTRHICVEGWSAIGKWGGVTFKTFLERIGADTDGEIRRLQVRGRLLHQHRHADRAASADVADVQVCAMNCCRPRTAFR